MDQNDNKPIFEDPVNNAYILGVSEQKDVGYLLKRIKATDRDVGLNVKLNYSIPDNSKNCKYKP